MGENDQAAQGEICMMTIVFPVLTDQVAIAVKAKIEAALSDQKGVNLDFRIMKGRNNPSLG